MDDESSSPLIENGALFSGDRQSDYSEALASTPNIKGNCEIT